MAFASVRDEADSVGWNISRLMPASVRTPFSSNLSPHESSATENSPSFETVAVVTAGLVFISHVAVKLSATSAIAVSGSKANTATSSLNR